MIPIYYSYSTNINHIPDAGIVSTNDVYSLESIFMILELLGMDNEIVLIEKKRFGDIMEDKYGKRKSNFGY